MQRILAGTATALAAMAVLTLAMLPLRSHLSIATTALILVVPVVIGVVTGGFIAGALSVAFGFLVYDFFFIPPYLTLLVGAWQNWAALGVYAVVMLLVAHVVARMNAARATARRQEKEIRQLFELSDLLVEEKPLDVLLAVIVTTLADVCAADRVALILPLDGRLEVAASAGQPLTDAELRQVLPAAGEPAARSVQPPGRGGMLVLALAAAGRPVGLLALSGETAAGYRREPLLLFANQVALAVERAQLREQALRARVTEEMAELAKTLVAAVSHDLRAPLASIKASSSTLADPGLQISDEAARGLAALIDAQADRLADLVQNLLDMSRIQAGALRPRRSILSPADLIGPVVSDLAASRPGHEVLVRLGDDLPPVDVDPVLISRVLTNLLENAVRHGPKGRPVTIAAALAAPGGPGQPSRVELSVTDHGPGISTDRRDSVFAEFARRPGDAGAGLGLTIARTFIEAHGQRIWVEDNPGGGARFVFTLPAAPLSEELAVAPDSRH